MKSVKREIYWTLSYSGYYTVVGEVGSLVTGRVRDDVESEIVAVVGPARWDINKELDEER